MTPGSTPQGRKDLSQAGKSKCMHDHSASFRTMYMILEYIFPKQGELESYLYYDEVIFASADSYSILAANCVFGST